MVGDVFFNMILLGRGAFRGDIYGVLGYDIGTFISRYGLALR